MNSFAFVILGILTLAGALAAAVLPRLIHAALCLVLAFLGVAAFYFLLGAEFVGLAQILVYVGAVAILIVFAILLTRSGDTPNEAVLAPGWGYGIIISALVFPALGWAVLKSAAIPKEMVSAPEATVKNIGEVLMNQYVLPLEVIGLLLTAAMIGAVIIALKEPSQTDNAGGKS